MKLHLISQLPDERLFPHVVAPFRMQSDLELGAKFVFPIQSVGDIRLALRNKGTLPHLFYSVQVKEVAQ